MGWDGFKPPRLAPLRAKNWGLRRRAAALPSLVVFTIKLALKLALEPPFGSQQVTQLDENVGLWDRVRGTCR